MANQLNGADFSLFGLIIQPGSTDGLLAFATRKDSTNHDFITEDGLDIDLDNPKFSARDFTFHCGIIADGVTIEDCFTNFWNQYNGLFTELAKPGLQNFYFDDHAKNYQLYYKSVSNVKKPTRISNLLKVALMFDLVVSEIDPKQNITPTYLVDNTGRFLVA